MLPGSYNNNAIKCNAMQCNAMQLKNKLFFQGDEVLTV
jgi:hypothetical protein